MTVAQAQQGKVYEVIKVSGAGNTVRRLLDIGITPKCRIEIAHIAPFGGTVMGGLRGFFIGLRRDCASMIEISEIFR